MFFLGQDGWDVRCHASWPEGRDQRVSKLLVLIWNPAGGKPFKPSLFFELAGDLGHAPSGTREILEEGPMSEETRHAICVGSSSQSEIV